MTRYTIITNKRSGREELSVTRYILYSLVLDMGERNSR